MPQDYQPDLKGKCKYYTYSEESIQLCIEAFESGALSLNKASKQYVIPKGTIQNKLKNTHTRSVGPPTVFSEVEEELFPSRVVTLCDWGFPLDKLDIRMMVAAYLTNQKQTVKKFINNIPGDDWVLGFMKCNRIATNIRRKRATISKEQLKQYFDIIQNELKDVASGIGTTIRET